MVQTLGVERVDQRALHVFLADEFGETLGAPLAGEDEVGHPHILPRAAVRPTRRQRFLVRSEPAG